jgi:hypothetical protein
VILGRISGLLFQLETLEVFGWIELYGLTMQNGKKIVSIRFEIEKQNVDIIYYENMLSRLNLPLGINASL